jgi:hypothetical protein
MTGKKIKIGGIPMTIASEQEAETCDYLICAPAGTPTPFDDNLKGICCKCGIDVIYRWHAPLKPKRICIDCIIKMENNERHR